MSVDEIIPVEFHEIVFEYEKWYLNKLESGGPLLVDVSYISTTRSKCGNISMEKIEDLYNRLSKESDERWKHVSDMIKNDIIPKLSKDHLGRYNLYLGKVNMNALDLSLSMRYSHDNDLDKKSVEAIMRIYVRGSKKIDFSWSIDYIHEIDRDTTLDRLINPQLDQYAKELIDLVVICFKLDSLKNYIYDIFKYKFLDTIKVDNSIRGKVCVKKVNENFYSFIVNSDLEFTGKVIFF